MRYIDVTQGSDTWKEMRRNHITSTDSSIIMNVNPHCSPLKLWTQKIQGTEIESNYAMERGTRLEPLARDWASNILQEDLYPKVVVSEEFPWAMSSLDGISTDEKTLIEIKCPGKKVHNLAKQGHIPDYYKCQIQHHLFVTGCERCHYISYDNFYGESFSDYRTSEMVCEDGVIIVVNRDEEFIKHLIKAEMEFLYKLRDFIAPDASPADFMPRPDDHWHDVSQKWLKAKDTLKRAEEDEERLKQLLVDIARGNNSVGAGIKLQRILRKGSVDYANISILKDICLDEYRKKPTEYWKVTEV